MPILTANYLDGFATYNNAIDTGSFAAARASNGDSKLEGGTNTSIIAAGFLNTNQLSRYAMWFDTTSLPSTAYINSATLYVMPNTITGSPAMVPTVTTLNTNYTVYQSGAVSTIHPIGNYGTAIATRASGLISGTQVSFNLNSSGMSAINKGSNTVFGLLLGQDYDNSSTGYTSGALNYYIATGGTYLSVNYTIPPVANFTYSASPILVNDSIIFTDTSTNTPTSWSWNFGDGNTSTSQNPTHQYTTAGTYTVALTATNAAGSNTNTKTNIVTVNNSLKITGLGTTLSSVSSITTA